MALPTLEEFIKRHKEKTVKINSNSYVKRAGFKDLYVRMGRRYIEGVVVDDVLDIANVVASKPGSGAFTFLAEEFHQRGFNLYVECVLNPRFEVKLIQLGFTQVTDYAGFGNPSFYKLAKGTP